ncbi:hypothetical protein Godav_001260, partial [Gossypium davidsonii]|nr:hypothetical protein [Gossypium davidsonii]MBA0632543.1 hypothetical protein [Gossypium davidsonii]MBA0668322.1 hypothetical protein [Gossypium klotzschianum]
MGSDYLGLIGTQGVAQFLMRNCKFDSLEAIKDIQESSLEGSNSALIRRIHQLLLRF